MNPDYRELLRVLLPEASLVLGALAVLGVDLLWARRQPHLRRSVILALGLVALVTAGLLAATGDANGRAFGGVLMVDRLAVAARTGAIVLAALALAFLSAAPRLRHPAEYTAIVLFATCGFTLMAVANQLLVAFLAIELASLSLYILAGFDKTSPASAEAGLKYFLFGGMSAAFLLFGFSLMYGLSGSIRLDQLAAAFSADSISPLGLVALVMVLVAFGFKAAAAPFHPWAPDVYEGAPAPAAALIASASKLAGLVLFTRLLWPGLGFAAGVVTRLPVTIGWAPVVVILSGASLLLGNIGALAQSNVRRLLAYSAIAHAGALLLGVLTAGLVGIGPVFYYAATYGLATVGAFGVIAVLAANGPAATLTDLAGLHRRSPLLAGCLAVFVLSLAGIPPLAGFFGKFAVFAAALRLSGVEGPVGWLALLAIALSVVALYYYLLILKQALVAKPKPDAGPITVPLTAVVALVLSAFLLVALGLWPSLLLGIF